VTLRVVLADDAALIRGALAQLLEDGGVAVLAQVGTPVQLLAAVDEHQPDVALVDIRMPPSFSDEGIRAALEIRERFPEVGILLLSTHVEVEEAVDLFSSAARGVGYLLKDSVSDLDELVDALTRIAEGGTVLDSKLVVELLEQRRRTDPLDTLTPREREVLALMAEGRSNDGIAKTLWVTKGAVEKHIKSIFGKLGLPATTDDHRRVLAVVTFLNAR
jgi:DNA-binding NarL/FixJ family response regulator